MTYFAYVSPKRLGRSTCPSASKQIASHRAAELGFGFGLGVGEVVLDDVFLGFLKLMRNASEGDIVGCCSVQMLPSGEKLQQLCDITNEKNCILTSCLNLLEL